jgi:hypothetical protein
MYALAQLLGYIVEKNYFLIGAQFAGFVVRSGVDFLYLKVVKRHCAQLFA